MGIDWLPFRVSYVFVNPDLDWQLRRRVTCHLRWLPGSNRNIVKARQVQRSLLTVAAHGSGVLRPCQAELRATRTGNAGGVKQTRGGTFLKAGRGSSEIAADGVAGDPHLSSNPFAREQGGQF